MVSHVQRQTVDLSDFPDLVVIYLGMRVRGWSGIRSLVRLGPQIRRAVAARPDGLLLHEDLIWGVIPLHVGMRQYWRDFASLEAGARTLPHQAWWHDFLRDSGGTGFWHETYFRRGGFEAIYDDLPGAPGFARFAPTLPATGRMFSARDRLARVTATGDDDAPA